VELPLPPPQVVDKNTRPRTANARAAGAIIRRDLNTNDLNNNISRSTTAGEPASADRCHFAMIPPLPCRRIYDRVNFSLVTEAGGNA
jgi:hypothetical protein